VSELLAEPARLAALALLGAVAFDLLLGEPPDALHPVVWMGRTLRACKRLAPAEGRRLAQLVWGVLVALGVPALFAAAATFVPTRPAIALLVLVPALKSSFALAALGRAGQAVGKALAAGDLDAARHGLRSLCSRDPARLDGARVAAAAIESVAENASDSFVAPLFYYALFGLPGAIAYRACNTLDAMIGYHGRYEYLGKPAARLDDLLNLVPARLTAAFLLAGGALVGADARAGWRIWHRDARKTESPNAGRPMATMAGLLGVELEKVDHSKLGDPRRPCDAARVDEAWRIVLAGAALALAFTIALVFARSLLWR
jgi:adenosylcobinamide-phosphate synthase